MQTALRRARLLKKISQSLNTDNLANTVQPNNGMIKVIENSNMDYNMEAEQLISNYTAANYAQQIVDTLFQVNPDFLREVVINWENDFKPIFERLRNSSINFNKLIDLILDKLRENLTKKTLTLFQI